MINKVRDYAKLEREFITGAMSLRESCRIHAITAHSSVVVQAKKGKWQEKRKAYRAKASESFIATHADRMADRQAELHDKTLDAIDAAITKFRSDMRATEKKHIDGEWVEVPVMRLTPTDVAVLTDRLQVLFEKPSVISQGLTVSTELSADALREFIDATRGRAGPSSMEVSPLPRTRRLDD